MYKLLQLNGSQATCFSECRLRCCRPLLILYVAARQKSARTTCKWVALNKSPCFHAHHCCFRLGTWPPTLPYASSSMPPRTASTPTSAQLISAASRAFPCDKYDSVHNRTFAYPRPQAFKYRQDPSSYTPLLTPRSKIITIWLLILFPNSTRQRQFCPHH